MYLLLNIQYIDDKIYVVILFTLIIPITVNGMITLVGYMGDENS